MRSPGGLILLTGIGVALFVYLPPPVDNRTSRDRLPGTVALRSAQVPRADVTLVSRLSAFSPAIALLPSRSPSRRAPATAPASAPFAAPTQASIASAHMGWQTIVSTAPVELTPQDPGARYDLVLRI